MDPQIAFLASLRLLLLSHVNLMLVINEVDNGCPRVPVIDVISEPGGIDDGELDFERFLLELGFYYLDFSEFVELFDMTAAVVLGW